MRPFIIAVPVKRGVVFPFLVVAATEDHAITCVEVL